MESPLKKIFGERLLHENENFFVIDKDNETVAHRNNENHQIKNVADIIRPYISFEKEDLRAGIVHRLDMETSGVMLCAKNKEALEKLQKLFLQRSVQKKYFALVHYRLIQGSGKLENYLKRDEKFRTKQKVVAEDKEFSTEYEDVENKELEDNTEKKGRLAISYYETIALFDQKSFLKVEIETGRTHQIRVQLANIGHPVVGDKLYSTREILKQKEKPLYLYAYYLSFPNPFNDYRLFYIQGKLPNFFKERIFQEKENFLKEKSMEASQ